eukprot:TRINITY_DN4103_c0_g1_i1.p1 TRINITY_DN4103_c0_g1~~TRINITY_DN4103_c0_g1_i1.p1  ORF type:complete len:105 (-),score=5.31 TRINITY_DN4103_c0_g1_i1:134-448(-)
MFVNIIFCRMKSTPFPKRSALMILISLFAAVAFPQKQIEMENLDNNLLHEELSIQYERSHSTQNNYQYIASSKYESCDLRPKPQLKSFSLNLTIRSDPENEKGK